MTEAVSPDQASAGLRTSLLVAGVGVAWLLLLALLIWLHARESTQPPVYDAYTYFAKAKLVWARLATGRLGLMHLLNIEPTFRPPGTVLMSYPFGFSPDFRGFYFRSVFFPAALVFLSVYLAAWRNATVRQAWLITLTAAFLSTLSLFYYFEPYTGGPPGVAYWGLVDGFFTGLAAFATGAAVRSISLRSLGWGFTATLFGALCIFVKPTGAMVAAMTGLLLAAGWLWHLRLAWPDSGRRKRLVARFSALVVVEAALLGGAVLLATRSRYLGTANMSYGNAALEVMRAELQIGFPVLVEIVLGGIGPFIPVWIVGAAVVWTYDHVAQRWPQDEGSAAAFLVTAALIALAFGIWFWWVVSGGRTQIRYFTPFLYVAIVCAVQPVIAALNRAAGPVRWGMALLMLVGIANLTVLLALPQPSLAWQLFTGVNVKSGTRPVSLEQARSVIGATSSSTGSVTVYSLAQGIADAMFESTFDMQNLAIGDTRFSIRRPFDWQRPTTVRPEELVASDYVLYDPTKAGASIDTIPLEIKDFTQEEAAFNTWMKTLTVDDGVEVASVEPDSTLLRIVDRTRLRASLSRFVAAHRWRDVFLADHIEKWWSEGQIVEALGRSPARFEHVRFEDKFEIRALSLVRLPDESTELRMWLKPSGALREEGWALFVHAVDSRGVLLANYDRTLGKIEEPLPDRPYEYLEVRFKPPKDASSVGIGFYRGVRRLSADAPVRDWEETRVLLALPGTREH